MSALANITAVMATSVDILTMSRPTVTAFVASSSLVPDITVSTSSSTAQSSSTFMETCGEWGDGAGPCARPYGRPNPTPEAWLSALSLESQYKETAGIPGVTTSSFFPIGIPDNDPPTASPTTIVSSSQTSSALGSIVTTLDASSPSSSACAPTTTVFITVTAASDPGAPNMTALADPTVYTTATIAVPGQLTLTYSGPNGPATTTETVAATNGTAAADHTVVVSAINGTGALTSHTLSVPTFTLTLSSPLPNGTAAVPSVSPVTSGADKVVPKPLGMGGSKSGNGVYCVVMLVALVALLI